MIAHRSPISGIDAFGDRYIATAGYDNQVILWDARTKKSLARACHDHLANQCRFSPDGTFLVSASSDYTARIWGTPDMRLRTVLCGHDDDIEMASISPDAARVATASRDHSIGIFCTTGRLQFRLSGHEADVISVEWTSNGSQLISASDDGTVRRWCACTGKLLETIDLGGVETDTIAVTSDGRIFAGNDAGNIAILSRGTVTSVCAHRAGIKRILYESRRDLLLTTSYDRTVRMWCVAGSDPQLLFEAAAPDNVWLRACSFSGRDHLAFGTFGSSYATFSMSRREWDLSAVETTAGLNAVRFADGHIYAIGDAGTVFRDGTPVSRPGSLCNFLGTSGNLVVTGGQAGILFNALTGETIYAHHSPLNCSAEFRRNGRKHLVVGTYTGEGLIFAESDDGTPHYQATLRMHDNAIKGLASNDREIFSICATGAAAFHSADTLEEIRSIRQAHRKISNGAATLPDGRFASVSRDLSLRIWSSDANKGASCEEFPSPHDHSIKCIAACPDSTVLATGSYNGCVALFDWRDRRWIAVERPTAGGISSLSHTGKAGCFLASSYDGFVYPVSATH
jgi:WD40 repeat protein